MRIDYIQVVIMIGYMAILVGVGLYMGKKVKNSTDYWVGGRSIGPFATAISFCAAYYSTVAIVGAPPMYYQYGLGYGALELLGSTFFTGFLIFVVIAPKMRAVSERIDVVSLPGFLAVRYKSNKIRVVSAAIIAVLMIPYAVSVMKGIADAMSQIVGLPYELCVVVLTVGSLLYVGTSGYWGVATTDVIQGVTITLAIVSLAVVTLRASGGWTPIVTDIRLNNPELMQIPGKLSWGQCLSWALITSLVAFGQPQLITKFMGLRDGRSIKTVVRTSVIWMALFLICAHIVGVGGHYLLAGQSLANIDTLAPTIATKYGGRAVSGIFMCGALAAGLSTLVALVLTASAAIAKDIFEDSLPQGKGCSSKKIMAVSRISTAVILLIVLLLSLKPWDFIWYLATMASGAVGAAFTAPLLLGLYWKRGTTSACMASMVSGAVVSVVWYALGLTNIVHSFLPGMVISFLVFVIVSKMTKPLPASTMDPFFKRDCNIPRKSEYVKEFVGLVTRKT